MHEPGLSEAPPALATLEGGARVPYLGRVAVAEREAVIARFHPRRRASRCP